MLLRINKKRQLIIGGELTPTDLPQEDMKERNVTREEINNLFPPSYGGNAQISDLRLMLTYLNNNDEMGDKVFDVPDIPTRDTLEANEGDICKVQNNEFGNPQTYIFDGNRWQILVENTGGGAISIDDLNDVDTSSSPPNNNQTLKWNGTNWVPADDIDTDTTYSAGDGLQLNGTEFSLNANLNNLNDVDPSGVAAGQVLKWNGTKWLPANDNSGSGSSLTKITESFEVNTIDQQNQYLELQNIPDTSDHLFVFLNGVYLTMGNNFDYILSSNRIEFQGGILTADDIVSIKYSY
jgi:hypothetical protein